MNAACLAWGSLLWKPGRLPLSSRWMEGGPELPLEFARVGDLGELSVVLLEGAPMRRTWWASLDVADADQAREALREREEIDPDRPEWVGSSPGDPRLHYSGAIAEWRLRRGLDVVVWTALPARIHGVEGRAPTPDEAVAYLAGLSGDTRAHARDYMRRVPPTIATPIRARIIAGLGWSPDAAGGGT